MQLTPQEDWVDNVLLEWSAALELHQRGRVSSILPLLVGDDTGAYAIHKLCVNWTGG